MISLRRRNIFPFNYIYYFPPKLISTVSFQQIDFPFNFYNTILTTLTRNVSKILAGFHFVYSYSRSKISLAATEDHSLLLEMVVLFVPKHLCDFVKNIYTYSRDPLCVCIFLFTLKTCVGSKVYIVWFVTPDKQKYCTAFLPVILSLRHCEPIRSALLGITPHFVWIRNSDKFKVYSNQ